MSQMSQKKMLINAKDGTTRIALIDGQEIFNLDIEVNHHNQQKGNVYFARVSRLEPSLEAAFVDYGGERHGFLPLKEISRDCFRQDPTKTRPHIREALKQGQEIIVQIEKEERGTKGAALSTFISLAGSYLVLMPNNPKAGGISRRIEGDERSELKDVIGELKLPEGMSVIIRTAGLGRSTDELQWDLDMLLTQWRAIQNAAKARAAPYLIYQESDVIIRALRDYLRPDISEILIDTAEAFEHAKKHIEYIRPDFLNKVFYYNDPIPLFNRYQIESQIESAHRRHIDLKNGGSIVIDRTEALIAIDINSSKATEGSDIEETAFKTNLAAAKEIARQLRLRDLGGLIVIDFIDMSSFKNQRAVETLLKDELKNDRARTRMGRISNFGLLEMSRQRLRPSLGDSTQIACPRCEGQGHIRSVPSLALALMRVIEEEAIKGTSCQLYIQVPTDIATFLMNEKREAFITLEKNHDLSIIIIPNPNFLTPHYELNKTRRDQPRTTASYQVPLSTVKTEVVLSKSSSNEKPAISNSGTHTHQVASTGLISTICSALSGLFGKQTAVSPALPTEPLTAASVEPTTEKTTHHQRRTPRKPHDQAPRNQSREPRNQIRDPQSESRRTHEPHRELQKEAKPSIKETKETRAPRAPRAKDPQRDPRSNDARKPEAPKPVEIKTESPMTTGSSVPASQNKKTPSRPLRQSSKHPANQPNVAAAQTTVSEPVVDKKTNHNQINERRDHRSFIKNISENSFIQASAPPEVPQNSPPLQQIQSKHQSTQCVVKQTVISEEFIKLDD